LPILCIASRISFELRNPKLLIVSWCRAVFATSMPVPKAAVDKQGDLPTGKNNIRFARQILSVQTKPVAHAM
jgi:hypothetical protein